MFLFTGLKASSGFSYVVPRAVFTWDFYKQHHIGDVKVVGTLRKGILVEEFLDFIYILFLSSFHTFFVFYFTPFRIYFHPRANFSHSLKAID